MRNIKDDIGEILFDEMPNKYHLDIALNFIGEERLWEIMLNILEETEDEDELLSFLEYLQEMQNKIKGKKKNEKR